MADPLHDPAAGDASPLVNNLEAVRTVLASARAYRAGRAPANTVGPRADDELRPSVTVLVRNDTGSTLPALSVVTPTGVVSDPSAAVSGMPYGARNRPCFIVAAPAAATDPVFVTHDGIKVGKIGRAVCQGVVPCQVAVSDAAHTHAVADVGMTATLDSAATGPVRILWKESGTGTKWALVLVVGDEAVAAAAAEVLLCEVTVSSTNHTVKRKTLSGGLIADYSPPTTYTNCYSTTGQNLPVGTRVYLDPVPDSATNYWITPCAAAASGKPGLLNEISQTISGLKYFEGGANAAGYFNAIGNGTGTFGSGAEAYGQGTITSPTSEAAHPGAGEAYTPPVGSTSTYLYSIEQTGGYAATVTSLTSPGSDRGGDAIIVPSVRAGTGGFLYSGRTVSFGRYAYYQPNDGNVYTGVTGTVAPGATVQGGIVVTLGSGSFYTSGGTDVSLADGGTGASLTDPNADSIMFWDDGGGAVAWLAPDGVGVEISTTTLRLKNQGTFTSLTDSTGGTAGATLSACGDTSTADQSGVINNNFASLTAKLDALAALVQASGMAS